MRELRIGLSAQAKQLDNVGYDCLCVAVVLLVQMMFQYSQVSAESRMLEAKVRQFENRVARTAGTNVKRDVRSLAAEVKQANHVLRMLGLSWDSVFAAVAAAHREGIALLAFAPEPEKGIVKINAEAKNFSVMLDYVQRLEAQPALESVYLQSHNMQNDNPQKPVRFVITADWLDK